MRQCQIKITPFPSITEKNSKQLPIFHTKYGKKHLAIHKFQNFDNNGKQQLLLFNLQVKKSKTH